MHPLRMTSFEVDFGIRDPIINRQQVDINLPNLAFPLRRANLVLFHHDALSCLYRGV